MNNPTTRGRRWTGRSEADRELEGECDRCEKWVRRRSLGGLCAGCCRAERNVQPVRVPSDEHPTPGLRVSKLEAETPVRALMLAVAARNEELAKVVPLRRE